VSVGVSALIIKTLLVGQLHTNCYLVADRETGEAMVVDPGAEGERIYAAVESLQAAQASVWVKYVVNTHAHFDHVRANGPLLDKLHAAQETPPELVAHADALPALAQGGGASFFGFRIVHSPEPGRVVGEGETLILGAHELQVMHTPGHSPGSISLYCADEGVLFCGDVLFRQGVGRYDLPGGSWAILQESIRSRLFTLPDATKVYPGHGPTTTIGGEKRSNPFVR